MRQLNRQQGQLVAYVVGLASDRSMTYRRVLADLVDGYEDSHPGHAREAFAQRWLLVQAELTEVEELLGDEAEGREAAPGPVSRQPMQPYPVECSSEDAYGTCLHRMAAAYTLLLSDLCRGCIRQVMEALDAVVPDGLPWHRSWTERAGLPAEEVSLR